jgi:viroplasmin and RNaseH domain-containing protein
MVWYVVFRGRNAGVYESWLVYSEYVIVFSGTAFQSYSTRCRLRKLIKLFRNISQKMKNMSLTSDLGKNG